MDCRGGAAYRDHARRGWHPIGAASLLHAIWGWPLVRVGRLSQSRPGPDGPSQRLPEFPRSPGTPARGVGTDSPAPGRDAAHAEVIARGATASDLG